MKKKFYLLATALLLLGVIGCKEEPTPLPTPEPTPTPSVAVMPVITIESIETTYNSALINLSLNQATSYFYRYGIKDGEMDSWTEKECATISTDVIELTLEANTEGRTVYTIEAYAVNPDTTSATIHENFQTPKAELVSAEVVVTSPKAIVAQVSMLQGLCEGYCIGAVKSAEWDQEDFISNCTGDWPQYPPVTADSTIMFEYLEVDVDYTIACVPITLKEDEWGNFTTGSVIGEPLLLSAKTSRYEIGQVDASLEIVANGNPNFSSIPVTITAGEGCTKYYLGAVKKEDLAEEDLAEYLRISDWFYIDSHGEATYPFMDFETWEPSDEVHTMVTNLSANTEYVVFAIAVNQYWQIGEIDSFEATTSDLTFDSPAWAEVSLASAHYQHVQIQIFFRQGCTKAYWANYEAGTMADDDAINSILSGMQYGSFWEYSGVYPIEYLTSGVSYDLFVLPVDAEGGFGQPIKYTYTTAVPTFEGTATIESATVTPLFRGEDNFVYTTINIVKGNNCATFMWNAIAKSLVTENNPTADAIAYGTYVATAWDTIHTDEDVINLDRTIWYEDYILVVIPIEYGGVNGTPVLVEIPYVI